MLAHGRRKTRCGLTRIPADGLSVTQWSPLSLSSHLIIASALRGNYTCPQPGPFLPPEEFLFCLFFPVLSVSRYKPVPGPRSPHSAIESLSTSSSTARNRADHHNFPFDFSLIFYAYLCLNSLNFDFDFDIFFIFIFNSHFHRQLKRRGKRETNEYHGYKRRRQRIFHCRRNIHHPHSKWNHPLHRAHLAVHQSHPRPCLQGPPPPRMPALDTKRYESLQKTRNKRDSHQRQQEIDFFFALNLRNVVDLLPRLLGSVVEAVRFLGPERCALSIVEGNSPDGTADVLAALKPFFDDIGLVYFYNTSDINPKKGPRIRKLAQLRNLALKPLFKKKVPVSDDTTVLFINDVAACTEDLLELALQRRNLNADMTCAMDWTYVADAPSFYDVWVARALNGDLFFNVTQDGQWDYAWNLFWNEPIAKARFDAHLPFQVFACWNGATAFTAAPLLHGLRFRDSKKDECFQGEPQLFCKDMWFRGYRKIAAIPSISLEYSDGNGQQLKQLKGYTSEIVNKQDFDKNRIEWQYEPPEKIPVLLIIRITSVASVISDPTSLNALGSDSIRRKRVANLARIRPKLDLLKSLRAILLQSHLAHLRLAPEATKLVLDNRTATGVGLALNDQLDNLIHLEDEALLEELVMISTRVALPRGGSSRYLTRL
ncbi:hypothetical protein NM208_g15925 [Fusarium decemcellulare]|uniref:Uncharacterized protein n=1 Tax=Fusarium decemcellulare TaxID=57161 RepID=A0ACC1RCW1_9HYPO|nr:hypothetical protein NM208_g15925 [Fusarium decemcellulare]